MSAQDVMDATALRSRLVELNDELSVIDARRAAIQGQIEKAKADRFTTGEFADPDWFRRANGALRHLGVDRAEVCREIGESNRQMRALNGAQNDRTFYLAVRDVVDEPTWQLIVARHEHLRAGATA